MNESIESLAASQFSTVDRAQMRGILDTLGVQAPGNAGVDWMRRKALAHLGMATDPGSATPDATPPNRDSKPLADAGFTNGPGWRGRWHIVIITAASPEIKSCPLSWEGWTINCPLGVEYELPEPHFNRLRDAVGGLVSQKRISDQETGDVRYDKIITPFRQFNYNYLGVKPGTENLPVSAQDYYQRLARKNNRFLNAKRSSLIRIYSALYSDADVKVLRQMKDEDIRSEILRFLGPEFEDCDGEFADEAVASQTL
jgi:hypothetical protein